MVVVQKETTTTSHQKGDKWLTHIPMQHQNHLLIELEIGNGLQNGLSCRSFQIVFVVCREKLIADPICQHDASCRNSNSLLLAAFCQMKQLKRFHFQSFDQRMSQFDLHNQILISIIEVDTQTTLCSVKGIGGAIQTFEELHNHKNHQKKKSLTRRKLMFCIQRRSNSLFQKFQQLLVTRHLVFADEITAGGNVNWGHKAKRKIRHKENAQSCPSTLVLCCLHAKHLHFSCNKRWQTSNKSIQQAALGPVFRKFQIGPQPKGQVSPQQPK